MSVPSLESWLSSSSMREWVRERVKKGGNAVEIELWTEEMLRRDYSPKELGEG